MYGGRGVQVCVAFFLKLNFLKTRFEVQKIQPEFQDVINKMGSNIVDTRRSGASKGLTNLNLLKSRVEMLKILRKYQQIIENGQKFYDAIKLVVMCQVEGILYKNGNQYVDIHRSGASFGFVRKFYKEIKPLKKAKSMIGLNDKKIKAKAQNVKQK